MPIIPAYRTVSAAGAARLLGLGKRKILELIKGGKLPAKELDGRYRVRIADVEAFYDNLPDAEVRR